MTTDTEPNQPTNSTSAAAAGESPQRFEDLDVLTTWQSGEQQPLTFSDAEFTRRLANLRQLLAKNSLDGFILTGQASVKYYSDFLFSSFGRSYALVVTEEHSTLVSANVDAAMPWRTSFGTHNIVYTDWSPDSFQLGVKEAFGRQNMAPRRIGVELDALTVLGFRELQAAFPDAELVDMSEDVTNERLIKSPEEIEVITEGARIADQGGAAIKSAIREGIAEYELALIGQEEMVHEIARAFPNREIRDTWVYFQSGVNTDGAHNWPTTRKLRNGDILSMNCFPMISGYYTALERTLFLGEPDKRTLELWNIIVEVHEAGLELIKPGAVCSEIASELNKIFIDHGLLDRRMFGYGHSFGLLSHYYGREGALELRESVDTVLEPGMVVSMEPMVAIPEGEPGAGGYREHDILVVTENGSENITKFPYGPEHNIIEVR